MTDSDRVWDFHLFLGAFLLSHMALLFWPESPLCFGLYSVFWSCFAFVKLLWILETPVLLEHMDPPQRRTRLPWVILNSMTHRARLEYGFTAMRAGDFVALLWALLGLLYIFWGVLTLFIPHLPSEFLVFQERISLFLESGAPPVSLHHFEIWEQGLPDIGFLLTLGIVLWLCRVYAYTTPSPARFRGALAGLLALDAMRLFPNARFATFFVPVENHWMGYGWGAAPLMKQLGLIPPADTSSLYNRITEMGMGGVVLFYMFCGFIGLVFLKKVFRKDPKGLFALSGLLLLGLFAGMDALIAHTPALTPFWISGWSVLVLLWHGAESTGQKTYHMNQV